MFPEKRLEMVHLQLTRNCNLRCWFCGQWGKKGFFSGKSETAMSLDEWKSVIKSLVDYRQNTGVSPMILLWGGEPLMYPQFAEIVAYLKQNDFTLGMVTNGVLIDKYADICRRDFKKIYVSIDGDREIHDSIRGKGVFDKVSQNLKLIEDTNAEIVFMTVMSPAVIDMLPELPNILAPLKPDLMLLQEFIALSETEICDYKKWMKSVFGIDAKEIESWDAQLPDDFEQKKQLAVEEIKSRVYPIKVQCLSHGDKALQPHCLSPFRHMHIAWNGNVLYCTDFYDFCAGNVKSENIIDIFNNELSEKFRREIALGNCATCKHCSWKNNKNFDF